MARIVLVAEDAASNTIVGTVPLTLTMPDKPAAPRRRGQDAFADVPWLTAALKRLRTRLRELIAKELQSARP